MQRSLLSQFSRGHLWLFVAVAVIALVLLGFYRTLNGDVADLRRTVAMLEQDVAWLADASAEVRRLQARLGTQATASTPDNMLLVIEQSAVEAGLRQSITALAPHEDTISVDLVAAPLVDVVRWLEQLEQTHGIAVATAQFRRAGPGRTDVRLQFERTDRAEGP